MAPFTNSRSTDAAFAQIVAEGTTDFLGNTIACGDIDGDGSDDLLVGAALHSASAVADDREVGAVYLITGSPIDTGDTSITDIAQKITGDETGMHLGAYVALADLNGDGDLDGLLGATESSIAGEDAGAVYGFFSLNRGLSPLEDADIVVGGTDPRGRLAVLDAGDLNGDGYDEIAIGGDRIDSSAVDAGAIYIFAGSASMQQQHTPTTADGRVIGAREGDRAGIGLHITDDIDQDGSPELAISIGFADTTAPEAGEVLLFSPWVLGGESLGYTDSMLRIAGTDTSGLLGFSINGRADMNQDGYPDLSITGLGYDDSGQDSGATFVLLGHGL